MPVKRRKEAVEPQAKPISQFFPALVDLSTPKPVKTLQEEWLEAFDDFWLKYPRKVGKFMARKAFLKIRPWNQAMCDEIFEGFDRWEAYWRDHETEKHFIPHPATWLNQHRWEDELDA